MIYAFKGNTPDIDPTAYISNEAVIIGDVSIGPRCYIGPGAIIRGDFAAITIGAECAIEEGVIIHAGGGGCRESVISNRVTIGHGAIVHSKYLGPGVSIGMGAVISLNASIGENSVVAGNCVVKQMQEISENVVVAGTPAKEIRKLSEKDIKAWTGTKNWYVELAAEYMTDGVLQMVERN